MLLDNLPQTRAVQPNAEHNSYLYLQYRVHRLSAFNTSIDVKTRYCKSIAGVG